MQFQPLLRVARHQPALSLLLLRQWHLEHLRALPRVWLCPVRLRVPPLVRHMALPSLFRLSLPRPQLYLSRLEAARPRPVMQRLPLELCLNPPRVRLPRAPQERLLPLGLPRQIVLCLERRLLRHLKMVLLSLALPLPTRRLLHRRLWLLTLWQVVSLPSFRVRPHRRSALPIPPRKVQAHRKPNRSLLAAMPRALLLVWPTAPLSRAGA